MRVSAAPLSGSAQLPRAAAFTPDAAITSEPATATPNRPITKERRSILISFLHPTLATETSALKAAVNAQICCTSIFYGSEGRDALAAGSVIWLPRIVRHSKGPEALRAPIHMIAPRALVLLGNRRCRHASNQHSANEACRNGAAIVPRMPVIAVVMAGMAAHMPTGGAANMPMRNTPGWSPRRPHCSRRASHSSITPPRLDSRDVLVDRQIRHPDRHGLSRRCDTCNENRDNEGLHSILHNPPPQVQCEPAERRDQPLFHPTPRRFG